MSVFYFLLLNCLGLATTTQAQDCGRPTGGPNLVPNSDISSSTFPDGTKVTFKCQPGYVTAGGNGRIACTNGTWSPLTLKCERRNCGNAGEVENGYVDYPEGSLFGDKIVIHCNTGYRLVGRREILCVAQGWDDVLPRCEVSDFAEVNCDEPDVPNGEWVEGARPPYRYRASVTYKCKSGYQMEGEPTMECGKDSHWSPEPPTCKKDDLKATGPNNTQDCGRPTGGPNLVPTTDISSSTFPDGSKATFRCQPGYIPAGGNGRITCTNGTWSPLTLKCERKNCGDGGHVENGYVDYPEGTLFGDKMVITCKPGYRLVGRSEILCVAQGWDDVLPRCEVVTCEPPSPPVDASYNPVKDTYNYREIISYKCTKKDDVLNGSKTISCAENEKFKPNPPTCVKVSCDEPDVPNGEWMEGARPPYGYLASVTYKCKSGYKMEGEASFTCEMNSRWSPEPPTCKNNGDMWKRCLGLACGVSRVYLVFQYYLL